MLENISRTGRTRLQPRIIRAGLFGKKIVLVHQTEIEGRGDALHGGIYRPLRRIEVDRHTSGLAAGARR